ncbi:MAG: dTDP-4-dehydrorhamnose reductase [Anaerolineae bacterium]|nr:dTDP-4-dehydrorhamnose reductase [Anaerolineae bacterium]
MRIVITGANGQLGQALQKVLTAQGETVIPTDVPEFDLTKHETVPKLANLAPNLIIHCAAMTNVDGCARDPELAFSVNAFGTQNVAHACLRCNADMVGVSTNEVFDGSAARPYREDDVPNPINPYGSSKRAGEQMAARYLKNKLYIVRTAWLYGSGGNNFPGKMITLADTHGELRVVTDEVSNPTYAPDLAAAIAQLIQTRVYGIYHFTNADYCSRYDFAKEILQLSGRENIPIHAITLADFKRASTVPPFAPLANIRGAELGIELRSWQEALQAYFDESGDK